MSGLIYNELSKIVAQRRFAVVIVILTLLAVLAALSMRGYGAALGINAASIVHMGAGGSFAQLIYPFFIAIVVGDIFAGELSSGTMKLLLIRPVSRWKIWLSKLAASYLIGVVVVLFAGVCFYVALGASTGFGSWSAPFGNGVNGSVGTVTLTAYSLEMVSILSVVSVFLLISTVVESGVVAVGICTGLAFICSIIQTIVQVLVQVSDKPRWIEFLFFEHWQIAGFVTRTYTLEHWTVAASLLDLSLWTALFVGCGIAIFQWKDVKG